MCKSPTVAVGEICHLERSKVFFFLNKSKVYGNSASDKCGFLLPMLTGKVISGQTLSEALHQIK